MRHVTDDERRARLAVRHALAPAARVATPEAATEAMMVLHSTDAATVYLSGRARIDQLDVADLQRALYRDRTLVKQLAMRRTLFVVPRDLLPAVWPSASARVAGTERAQIARDVVKAGLATDGDDWLDRAREAVLELLADVPEGLLATEIRKAVPIIDLPASAWSGSGWASRVLTQLGASAEIVRGENTTGWHNARARWTLTSNWLGTVPDRLTPADGYRELVRRWLRTFGPGTEDDIVWFLGATKTIARTALAALDAVEVTLDGGRTGWLLPDDLDEAPDPGSWVALLPVLDPTVMGWKSRDFYLGPHRDQLFDRNGNAGSTAWADGRIVGCWVQDAAGVVELRLLEHVPPGRRAALEAEAKRLTQWLDGFRVPTGWASPAMRT
jgi:hypothetical protein